MFHNLTYRRRSLVIAAMAAICIAALAPTTSSARPTISPAARSLAPGVAARAISPLPVKGGVGLFHPSAGSRYGHMPKRPPYVSACTRARYSPASYAVYIGNLTGWCNRNQPGTYYSVQTCRCENFI